MVEGNRLMLTGVLDRHHLLRVVLLRCGMSC